MVDRESTDMGAFMRRVIRAMVRRAGTGDLDAVIELGRLRAEVQAAYRKAGAEAIAFGYSYGDMSRHLGISRQAAQQAFGLVGGGSDSVRDQDATEQTQNAGGHGHQGIRDVE